MLYHWGFTSGDKPNPDFARSLIALWSIVFCNSSYLISRGRILYSFARKFLLLISVKISSLSPLLNSFNIELLELKTSSFVDFVNAVFSKHSEIIETHAKGWVKFTQFLTLSFFFFLSLIYIFRHAIFWYYSQK